MKVLAMVCLGVSALGLTVACGGGDDDGEDNKRSSIFNSTLPDSKLLGALTIKEGTQFCVDMRDWERQNATERATNECRAQALEATTILLNQNNAATDADLRNSCEERYASCMQVEDWKIESACGAETKTFSEACKASVAEMEACLNELDADYKKFLQQVPECKTLTRNLPKTYEKNLGPACKALQAKCPDLSGEEGASAPIESK